MKITDWIHERLFGAYPEDVAPTIRIGYVATAVRYESTKNEDMIGDHSRIFWDYGPRNLKVPDASIWFVSHQQKVSRWGFLIQKPFCVFIWYLSKLQEKDVSWGWQPGTEYGWVFRSPGWRFDVPGTYAKHWIRTFGHFGRHLD